MYTDNIVIIGKNVTILIVIYIGYNNILTSDTALKQQHETDEMATNNTKMIWDWDSDEDKKKHWIVKYQQGHGSSTIRETMSFQI